MILGTSGGSLVGLLGRARRTRFFLLATIAVFAGFYAIGALTALAALAGTGLLCVALLIGAGPPVRAPELTPGEDKLAQEGHGAIAAVLAGLPDPVVALTRSGEVIAFNTHAGAILPTLRRGEQVSLSLRAPDVVEAIRRAAADGGTQRAEFFERVPMLRWHEAIAVPIELAAKSSAPRARATQLLLVTFHDLTPLRRVEEMRADFIANASHELRTPLAALSGFIETLRGSARDDAVARERFLTIMQAQANRMARLIDDLLSLSRIEINVHVRPDKEVDLVSIIRQVVDGLQTLALDRDVEVRISPATERLMVRGDRDELVRVFENLIENALKYGAHGKLIEVTPAADESKSEARVAVRDYGPGISPEHIPRLTERFYRVNVTDSRAQGGTGLGLALVKHILNRHGGRLMIESVLGKGAVFTAVMPLPKAGSSENTQLPTKT